MTQKKKNTKNKPKNKSVAVSKNPTLKGFGVTPLGDRVLVRELEEKKESKTNSGIYIPENVRESKGSKKGEVVALGEGRFENGKVIPMRVKVGDHVLYQWGETFEYNGVEYTVVREGDLIGIVKA